jgi:putative SOS response-associated peptidase YedK
LTGLREIEAIAEEARNTCAIITTTANLTMSDVHDRMPVILSPESYDLWLDPGFGNVADLTDLLKPYSGTMRRYPVSARVNAVVNDDAACAEPVTLKQAAQGGLFESR